MLLMGFGTVCNSTTAHNADSSHMVCMHVLCGCRWLWDRSEHLQRLLDAAQGRFSAWVQAQRQKAGPNWDHVSIGALLQGFFAFYASVFTDWVVGKHRWVGRWWHSVGSCFQCNRVLVGIRSRAVRQAVCQTTCGLLPSLAVSKIFINCVMLITASLCSLPQHSIHNTAHSVIDSCGGGGCACVVAVQGGVCRPVGRPPELPTPTGGAAGQGLPLQPAGGAVVQCLVLRNVLCYAVLWSAVTTGDTPCMCHPSAAT